MSSKDVLKFYRFPSALSSRQDKKLSIDTKIFKVAKMKLTEEINNVQYSIIIQNTEENTTTPFYKFLPWLYIKKLCIFCPHILRNV